MRREKGKGKRGKGKERREKGKGKREKGYLFVKSIACCCVVLLFVVFLAGCFGRSPVKQPTNVTGPIVVFGDSLVEGVGSERGGGFVTMMSEELGEEVLNAGVAGDTTSDGLKRLDEDVLSNNPRIVVVVLGGNDALRNVKPDVTFSNLEQIVDRIQARGAGVVLVGSRGGLQNAAFKKRFPDLSEEKGAVYLADSLEGIFRNKELMYDTVHPNDRGYFILAERVLEALEEFE